MTRVLILTIFLYGLNALPPAVIWKSASHARAADAGELFPLTAQVQTPQRLQRSDIPSQRLQQPVPAGPKAEIDPPRRVVTQGQPAIFDSKSIADPDVPISVHQWSGPERQTSNGPRFVVNTANLKPATYTVTLVVRDRQQRQGRDSATLIVQPKAQEDITINNRPPVARISRAALEIQQGAPARFSSVSYHPDRNRKIVRSTWRTSWGQTASGDYIDIDTRGLSPGTYTVTLEVFDDRGARDSAPATLTVTPPPAPTRPPVARISPDRSRVNQGARVRFFTTSYHPDGKRKIIRTLWQTSWGQRASGDYIDIDTRGLNPGEYSVDLNVVDDNQASDSATATLIVEAVKATIPPVAAIRPDLRRVNQGARVNFSDASYHPNRDTKIVNRRWSTQWGQTDGGQTLNVDTAALPPGTYWITLEVADQYQKTDSAKATLEILPAVQPQQPPIARITPRRIEVQQRELARFDGSRSTDADGKIRTWTWSLNDKPIDRQPSAHIDTRGLIPGEYRVHLEVTDDQGLTARDEALLIVVEPPRDVDAAIVQLDVWPAPVSLNREVQIRAMVANRGKDALRNVPVRFEVGGIRIAEKMLPSLAPGETREVSASWIPKAAGEQIVIATINPENQPPEGNRSNNLRRHAIPVLAQPNVRIDPNSLEVSQGDSARFAAQLTTPGQPAGGDVKYFWRGPGNRTGQGAEFQIDTGELPPGNHKIVLEISERGGFKATAGASLIVRRAKAQVWLAADTQNPDTGRAIRFTTGTRPEFDQIQYKFIFGDGTETEWSPQAQAVHRYGSAGDYTVRVLAQQTGADLGEASSDIIVKDIVYGVSLRTETESVRAGDSLSFTANVEPSADDIEYRFIFGDGQESGWTRNPRAAHSYSGEGGFEATVEARIGGAQIIRSPIIRVNVSASPRPPWLLFGVGFAVLAAAAAAYIKKTRLARVQSGLTVVPKLNLENLRVETQGKFKSGCEISLRAVRRQSRLDIEASEPIVNNRGN